MSHAATIPVDVTAVEQVTPLIKQFTLGPVAGGELPPFSGGSHVIVVLRRRDRTFRSPYSLMGSPRDRGRYRIAVRRHDDGRGGSLYMKAHVCRIMRLDVSHPVNLFPLARLARKHVLVAGGVGVTPVTAMIDDLRGGRVPWELHYVVRGSGHDHFGRQLLEGGGPVRLYYGSAGLDLGRVLAGQPLGTHVDTCGPAGMIEAVARAARAAGWADSHIHHEEFASPPVGHAFDAHLARSDLTVHVPLDRSRLEAIEAVGVRPPYLCRGGVCGECETDVLDLEGELVHNDHWLSAEQKAGGRAAGGRRGPRGRLHSHG